VLGTGVPVWFSVTSDTVRLITFCMSASVTFASLCRLAADFILARQRFPWSFLKVNRDLCITTSLVATY